MKMSNRKKWIKKIKLMKKGVRFYENFNNEKTCNDGANDGADDGSDDVY